MSSRCSTGLILSILCKSSRWVLPLPFYRWENWGSGRVSNFLSDSYLLTLGCLCAGLWALTDAWPWTNHFPHGGLYFPIGEMTLEWEFLKLRTGGALRIQFGMFIRLHFKEPGLQTEMLLYWRFPWWPCVHKHKRKGSGNQAATFSF